MFTSLSLSGSGNVLKVQQLLHICSEHYDNTKDKEEDKDKKDKKDKEKKESAADMGSHQVSMSEEHTCMVWGVSSVVFPPITLISCSCISLLIY